MKKPVFCLLAILFLGGMVRAEDSAKSLIRVSDQARFSRDHVTAELSLHENGKEDWKLQRAQRGGLSLNNKSRATWLMITGIGTLIAGLTLMATSTEKVTGVDPSTGQEVTVKQVRSGRRYAGYSLVGASGFFMYWASMQ